MKINRITGCLLALLIISNVVYADPIEEGKTLFLSRCAGCHNVNQKLTGPALAGVDQRRSIEWIINFVHSSQTMVKKGDKDAVAIFEKFNKVPMPDHPDLTEENIKGIVDYIKSESKPVVAVATPIAKPHKKASNAKPLTSKDYGIFSIYLLMVASLIAILLFAVHVQTLKRGDTGNSLSA